MILCTKLMREKTPWSWHDRHMHPVDMRWHPPLTNISIRWNGAIFIRGKRSRTEQLLSPIPRVVQESSNSLRKNEAAFPPRQEKLKLNEAAESDRNEPRPDQKNKKKYRKEIKERLSLSRRVHIFSSNFIASCFLLFTLLIITNNAPPSCLSPRERPSRNNKWNETKNNEAKINRSSENSTKLIVPLQSMVIGSWLLIEVKLPAPNDWTASPVATVILTIVSRPLENLPPRTNFIFVFILKPALSISRSYTIFCPVAWQTICTIGTNVFAEIGFLNWGARIILLVLLTGVHAYKSAHNLPTCQNTTVPLTIKMPLVF